jgi:hypothetical protein
MARLFQAHAGANKENVDEKGKAPLRAEDIEAAEEADAEDDEADDEDDAKEGDAGDMQVRCPQDASYCPSTTLSIIKGHLQHSWVPFCSQDGFHW